MTQTVESSALTTADILALPPTVDVVTAGKAFGLGSTTAYQLARTGKFPCKILRAGGSWRVVTADLRRVLEISERPEVRASA